MLRSSACQMYKLPGLGSDRHLRHHGDQAKGAVAGSTGEVGEAQGGQTGGGLPVGGD
jgi:hypothetical protein